MAVPTLIVAGTHSGVGKTTVATALMAALARRGMRVQAFKVGPDFIDPSFHCAATGRPGHNLDGWMLSRETNLQIFSRAAADADTAIIEGVMGLFDGHDGITESGSTAEMAKWLNVPVVLVVDAAALARSVAAIVRGFEEFDPDVRLLGVIFNRVAGSGHYAFLRDALAQYCKAIPLGYLPSNDEILLPDRHLGLVMAEEVLTDRKLEALAVWVERGLDLSALLDLAKPGPEAQSPARAHQHGVQVTCLQKPRIGIARDRAFCFYYQDNLDLLEACGAELVEFSPTSDTRLPAHLDGLYLGGGYPELYAEALSKNETMRADIAMMANTGAPVFAECGGFMYLTKAIVDAEGRSYPMVGVFPTQAHMQRRLAAIGYAEVEIVSDTVWLRAGERLRGHEFRYSSVDEMPEGVTRCYRVKSVRAARSEGFAAGGVLSSYVHLHFASCPAFASRFVAACAARHELEMKGGGLRI